MDFTKKVLTAQIKAGPDKFEPDRIINHAGIYTIAKQRGIATLKEDSDIIKSRLKVAAAVAQEIRNEKQNH